MFRCPRSKIGVQLLVTFAFSMALSMGTLSYIAARMVVGFGEYSASRNEESLRENAKAFMARITHEQAMRYESVFAKLAGASYLVADQAAFFLNNEIRYGASPLDPAEEMFVHPRNQIFTNARNAKTMVLYWASPVISPEIDLRIRTLSHIDPLLEAVKKANPESVACYIVAEPGISRYSPNIHGVEKLPPVTDFNIKDATWYVIAKPENNPGRETVWSNIYLDSVGQGLTTTASTPIYGQNGEFLGAAGVDITLDSIMEEILANIPSCHKIKGLFSFLIDNQGRLIAFPPEILDMFEIDIDRDKLVNASVTLDRSLLDSANPEIVKIGEKIIEADYHSARYELKGHPLIFSSHVMPSTGWRLGIVVPESNLFAPVAEVRDALDSTVDRMTRKFLLFAAIFIVVSIVFILAFFIRTFVRPLEKLALGAARVREGELSTHVEIDLKNEIGSLARLFNNMVEALRQAREREKRHAESLERKVKDRTLEIEKKNEELESMLRTLEQEVLERKLAEKEKEELQSQLFQTQKMKSMGTLSGGIAHEFNNILSIILGNTELAIDDIPKSNEARGFLSEVRNACLRGKDIVLQLLSFTRKSPEKKQQLDLPAIAKDAVKFLRASIPANIEFNERFSEECPPLTGDRTLIHQLIANLCNNAAQAMEDKGGIVEIRVERAAAKERLFSCNQILEPGEYARLSVADSGHGIPDDIIAHIFDPFFTTKDVNVGTGMGLAVAYGIVKSHGGFIKVDSQPGKGAVFSCYFPPSAHAPADVAEKTTKLRKGVESILVVDDEQALANTIKLQLERLGYVVSAYTDPAKALEDFKADPKKFDLAITDMAMPGMYGDRFLAELKKTNADIKTIVCTGYSKKIDEEKAAQIGADAFLMKPLDVATLAETVRKALDG